MPTGFKLSEETKRKISDAKKKNPTRFWLGKKRPEFSEFMKKRNKQHPIKYWLGKRRTTMTGDKNWNWKGGSVQYRALHSWIERILGKPNICEHCGKKGNGHSMHWANKSGRYLRSTKDWLRLCVKCHKAYDLERIV